MPIDEGNENPLPKHTDRIFAVAGNWALASDGLQWMLMRRHKRPRGDTWDPVWFVRSTKDILAQGMREKGVEPGTADLLLAGLPDTFDQWKLARPTSQAQLARA